MSFPRVLGNLLLTALYFFIAYYPHPYFIQLQSDSPQIFLLVTGISWLWLTFFVNAITQYPSKLLKYLKSNWVVVGLISITVYIWGVLILPLELYSAASALAYWMSYMIISFTVGNKVPQVNHKSKLEDVDTALLYLMWLIIFCLFVSPAILLLGKSGLIVGPVVFILYFVYRMSQIRRNPQNHPRTY